ncbi:hypothetical protein KH5H1_66770 [Corallococcus caeni]|nr:hypothetical protein KH5H1_66770 [Corallococcus sp. KH5-1]
MWPRADLLFREVVTVDLMVDIFDLREERLPLRKRSCRDLLHASCQPCLATYLKDSLGLRGDDAKAGVVTTVTRGDDSHQPPGPGVVTGSITSGARD